MVYVDANFWIYWFDQRLSEHRHVLGIMSEPGVLETIRESIANGEARLQTELKHSSNLTSRS